MSLYNVVWLTIMLVIVISPISLVFGVELWRWLTVLAAEIVFLVALGVLHNE